MFKKIKEWYVNNFVYGSFLYDGFMKIKAVPGKEDGKIYEQLVLNGSVAAVIYDKEGKVAIVHQYRPALGRTTQEIPAGTRDTGISFPLEVMRQEIREEMDFTEEDLEKLELIDTIYYHSMVGLSNDSTYLFVMEYDGIGEDKDIDSDKGAVIKLSWKKPEDVKTTDLKTLYGLTLV